MDFKIIHVEETGSTNRWIKEYRDGSFVTSQDVTKEPSLCYVVVAEYQTAGKGCSTNTWESERGKNLTFSLLIHPEGIAAKEQFFISEAVSVALCETLAPYIHQKVEIKWPNDIYVGDRKICGILIENRLQGSEIKESIIGIGLNVNQRVFRSDAPNPVSLYQLTDKETDREVLLNSFLQAFDKALHNKKNCLTYRELLYRKGIDSLYKDKTVSSTSEAAEPGGFVATLKDVLPDGRLLLVDKEGQERTYAFKEVEFVIIPPNNKNEL